MRIGIVVCASAEIDYDFITEHDLNVLPISVKYGDTIVQDVRDPKEASKFYDFYLKNPRSIGNSRPLSVEQIRDWFLDELVLKYDRVLVLALSSEASQVFKNANQASFSILKGYREVRKKAGIEGSFSLRVIDTKKIFTQEAVVVREAIRMLKEDNLPFKELRQKTEDFSEKVTGFLVPRNLFYLRNVARRRGYKAMSAVQYHAAKALNIIPIITGSNLDSYVFDKGKGFDNAIDKLFDHVRNITDKGLHAPFICMSYGGDLNEFKAQANFIAFKEFCEKRSIKINLTQMSALSATYVGPGSFALSLAPVEFQRPDIKSKRAA